MRILDSRKEDFRLSKAYVQKIDVVNIITAPEIEMLIIHAERAYDRFKSSGKKPSDFCKVDLRMHNVKTYDFVKDYFSNPQILINAIIEYRRKANIPKGEHSLFARSDYKGEDQAKLAALQGNLCSGISSLRAGMRVCHQWCTDVLGRFLAVLCDLVRDESH